MKNQLLIFIVLFSTVCFSQINNTVKFHILFEKNIPASAVNIIIKNSSPMFGVQTDFNGYAKLVRVKENDVIEINYAGPTSPNLTIIKSVDSIAINLKKKKIVYYSSKKRKIKTIRYK